MRAPKGRGFAYRAEVPTGMSTVGAASVADTKSFQLPIAHDHLLKILSTFFKVLQSQ